MPSDAIVIGAGHNGLVAANLLADAGWSVTVVDATAEPGGAVRTAELTAPGYLNDVFSAFYPMVAASPVMAGLGLDRYGLRLRDAPDVLAHVLPDGRAAVLNRDPQRTAVSVEKFAPGDGARWLAEFDQWRRISTPLTEALFAPFPPVRPAFGLWRRAGAGGLLRLAR
ncbi:MAG: NAD(P)/FAD-dependent oxidoreductase, partial [Nonomuraea sp.]|nr:NAD(P)/FAD-dependent oxidoreductase [Nonomuraea sp.]